MAVTINGTTGIDTPSLTADTTTLVVDETNNRVGIGTASPTQTLQVDGFVKSNASDSSGIGYQLINSINSWNIQTPTGVEALAFVDNTLGEAMRIDSSGNLLVGTTDDALVQHSDSGVKLSSSNGQHQLARNGGGGVLMLNRSDNDNVTRDVVVFFRNADNCGTITASNTTTNYNTSSDYRLKENVVDMTNAIDRVKQLKPSRFNWISNPDVVVDGFVAHEAQVVVPEAVSGEKDAVDDEGNPKYQGIDQSKLVPLLTGALQEAIAEIESLKARVEALETP